MLTITIRPGEGTLQQAIDSLPRDGSEALIRLSPGEYHEKLTLNRPHTILEGSGADVTRITWQDAAADPMPGEDIRRGTFRSYTLFVDAEHVTLRGLTVENAARPREEKGQCIALFVDGDHFLCEDCTLDSCQDTLFTAPLPPREAQKNGFIGPTQHRPRTPQRQTYRRCVIRGDVDFIFGGAAAWFEGCDIVSVGAGYATAASTPQGQAFGYVFKDCRFLSGGAQEASVYLGRPWREYAKTILLDCELGAHIRPEGWHDWNKPVFHSEGLYGEHGCYGPGAAGQRVPYARALTEEEASACTYEAFLKSL